MAEEYDALFQGIGKPDIFLYGSFLLAGAMNDQPLVELRNDLAALGLERPDSVTETEDHMASLCEVMRYLIAGDDLGGQQPGAAAALLQLPPAPWLERCATRSRPIRAPISIARGRLFTRDFVAIEVQGFELLDA